MRPDLRNQSATVATATCRDKKAFVPLMPLALCKENGRIPGFKGHRVQSIQVQLELCNPLKGHQHGFSENSELLPDFVGSKEMIGLEIFEPNPTKVTMDFQTCAPALVRALVKLLSCG